MLTQPSELLLVTNDSELISHVQRIASAIGMSLECRDNPFRAHVDWESFSYVLLGDDLAQECQAASLPRRSGLAIVHGDREISPETGAWERELWKCAVTLGAENVIGLPGAEFWLRDTLAQALRHVEDRGSLIAVIPGSGGAGATTLAVNLGLRAVNQGTAALVIDADPVGGGIDLILGAEELTGTRWCDIDPGTGRIAADTLAHALPTSHGLTFLSHGRGKVHIPDTDVVAAVVDAGRRAFDLVIVDLPRGNSSVAEQVVAQADLTLIAVRNHVRAVAASASLRSWVRTVGGSAHFVATADQKGVSIMDVSLALGEKDLSEIPFIPSMCTRADEGDYPSMPTAYAQVCDRLLGKADISPKHLAA